MIEYNHDNDAWMQDLLAPLNRLAPVSLADIRIARGRVRRRVLLSAGVAVAALILATGVAFADGVNPFAGIAAFVGISAANHPATPQDTLDPEAAAVVQEINDSLGRVPGTHMQLLPETARLVGQLPDGGNVYLLESSAGDLCVVGDRFGGSCGRPPTAGSPTTLSSFDRVVNGPGATPPVTWGIAEDGVVAVSFQADNTEHTVPVVHNVWFYVGQSNAGRSLSVHYADGTTQVVTH
jgi:hypothetical protein